MTAKAAKGLATAIRRELAALADPERARGAQAYLKSEMPCWGVPVPEVRAIVKRVFSTYPLESREDLEEAVLAVWTAATRREERLAAVVMTGDKRAKRFHDMEILPFYERLIREGAWWDLVDELAAHRLHLVLAAEPAKAKRAMLAWAKSDDLWVRRSAILCQISLKGGTDLDLLERTIRPSLGRKEFFLRKAIGWALRSYAWHDPAWVEAWVRAHEAELAPLSVREALKNVGKARR